MIVAEVVMQGLEWDHALAEAAEQVPILREVGDDIRQERCVGLVVACQDRKSVV